MVSFDLSPSLTEFTFLCEQSLYDFTALAPDRFDRVADGNPFAPLQGDASELCNQRFLVRPPLHPDLEHFVGKCPTK
jgi:hypothetical protein